MKSKEKVRWAWCQAPCHRFTPAYQDLDRWRCSQCRRPVKVRSRVVSLLIGITCLAGAVGMATGLGDVFIVLLISWMFFVMPAVLLSHLFRKTQEIRAVKRAVNAPDRIR